MDAKNPAENSNLNPETWVDRYGDYLYRFAVARVKDATIAEDLVQETFLAALRGRKNFRSRSAVQTWLTAILKHKIEFSYYVAFFLAVPRVVYNVDALPCIFIFCMQECTFFQLLSAKLTNFELA